MTTLKQLALAALLAVLLLLSGYFLGKRTAHAPEPELVIRVDTLRIRDTLLVEKPVPVEVRVVDTMLVAVTDTVTVGDTVYLSLPRETKVYGDSTYTAQVSGYRPALDWIEIYPQKTVVTRTISVDSRKRWGIGLQAGYGMHVFNGDLHLSPYIGIGISWDIVRW